MSEVFEAAADAVAHGDAETLGVLLRGHPGLPHERSSREHRSTLLHYVSANGVEDSRQRTPSNILAITRLLLDAGADVNAESDAYGGHSTPLGLTATSRHPEAAGVQIALMELLIARGAVVDAPNAVNSCLHNGRGTAARFLAEHGARLDLEGAAGVGRLDLVRELYDSNPGQRDFAFAWACQFGYTEIVEYLLSRGMPAATPMGLHWAAHNGKPETVELLLGRGASIEPRDPRFDGTPLDWAMHGWLESPADGRTAFPRVVTLLIAAGAKPESRWVTDATAQGDDRMLAALQTNERPRES